MQTEHKGLFFDPARNRWRVRLYRGSRVVHLSYHRVKDDALRTFETIAAERPEVKTPPTTMNLTELIHFLS